MKIENLKQLTNGETPYSFGRMLYKYTDCGPWVSFTVPDKPERIERYAVEVRKVDGKLRAKSMTSDSALVALEVLGFNEDGSPVCRWRSLRAYRKRVEDFFRKEKTVKWEGVWTLDRNQPCIGCVRIELTRTIPATTRDVYYGSEEANKPLPGCVGVKIGSIVEGSNVEIPPEYLKFPFEKDDFWKAVERIDKQAGAVWEWANEPKDKLGRRHRNGKTDAERGLDCPIF